jgi:hypothetical protein
VPHRGHAIVLPCGARGAAAGGSGAGPGAIGIGIGGIGIGPDGIGIGIAPGGIGIGPDGIGAPPSDPMPPIAPICADASAVPQLRQNFIPGGFSPRHDGQITGNPPLATGVFAWVSALPQLRQNDDPGGLSWPQTEQRINPLWGRVWQQPRLP